MAVDKSDAAAVQTGGDAAKTTKKTKKPAAPKLNTIQKAVAEAKAAYKDLDLSEGRSLRKRAAAPSSAPKKSPAKKAKKPAAKKGDDKPAAAKKGAKGAAKKGKGAKEDGEAATNDGDKAD